MTEETKSVRETVDYKTMRGRTRREIRVHDLYRKLPILLLLALLHLLLMLATCQRPSTPVAVAPVAPNLDNCTIGVEPLNAQVGDTVSVFGEGLDDLDHNYRVQLREGSNAFGTFSVDAVEDGSWSFPFTADEARDYEFAYDILNEENGVVGTCNNAESGLAVAAAPTDVPPTDVPAIEAPEASLPSFNPATLKWGALAAGGTYLLGEQIDLGGTASANSNVRIDLDGFAVDTVAADADGNWTYTPSDLATAGFAPGRYEYTATALDADGADVGTAAEWPFYITQKPTVDSHTVNDDGTVLLAGSAIDSSTGLVTFDGTELGEVAINADGTWALPTADVVEPGTYVTTIDQLAIVDGMEVVRSDEYEFTIAEAAGPVMLTFDTAVTENNVQESDETVTADIVMSGLGEPGATVELFDPEGNSLGTTVVADDGTWTYTSTGYNGIGVVDLTANQTIEGELVHTDVPNNVELAVVPRFPLTVAIANADQMDDATPLGTLPTVHLILDASWSMTLPPDRNDEASRLTADDPGSRIKIAQNALLTIINDYLPEGAPVGLRAFGNRAEPLECQTELEAPVAPLDKVALSDLINNTLPQYNANTAIAAALNGVPDDLAGVEGDVKVVLLTDGRETCGGNPAASIAALRDAGFDVVVDIVGFAIADNALKAEFESWAETGGGSYYDAADAEGLASALGNAFGIPYEVLDGDTVIATGQIGAPLSVPAGEYSINILTNPPVQIDGVTVSEDGTIVTVK